MDPYVEKEDQWSDFRKRFVSIVATTVERQLPEHLATIIVGRDDPDVVPSLELLSWGEPVGELERFALLTVVEVKPRRLRALIEVLTPLHKRDGIERDSYLRARRRWINSGVDLLEIDLLRGGERLPLLHDAELPVHDFRVVETEAAREIAALYLFTLRDRLPTVPVPLCGRLSGAALDLQQCFDHVYDTGAYRKYIHLHPPEPPLTRGDAEWAAEVLSKSDKGLWDRSL